MNHQTSQETILNANKLDPPTILVTGAAGFIGYHLSKRLLSEGYFVVGIDNLNPYYDPALKEARRRLLEKYDMFRFTYGDISDAKVVAELFETSRPGIVINLAAQAGVRYSLENPAAYVQSNLVGFANILEACRQYGVTHLLYASSSSVYGGNTKVPFAETDPVDHPVSLYAATKRSNELMADSYAHLYKIPITGLRFFTVYGPYGRPDMAYYSFADRYFSNRPIHIFNDGDTENDLSRDFTYIDDVVESVVRLLPIAPVGSLPHRVLNVGGSTPESLMFFIQTLEEALSSAIGKPVVFEKVYEPIKPGDVPKTYANADKLHALTGYKPSTTLEQGLSHFAQWYIGHHNYAL